MKETGTAHWISPNTGATNESGFTALPGSYRLSADGSSYLIGYSGFWWSSSKTPTNRPYVLYIGNSITNVYINGDFEKAGSSVRCIKGELTLPAILLLQSQQLHQQVLHCVVQ